MNAGGLASGDGARAARVWQLEGCPGSVARRWVNSFVCIPHLENHMTYEKPTVKRFGSLRELTLGGGAQMQGDATNLYHRS